MPLLQVFLMKDLFVQSHVSTHYELSEEEFDQIESFKNAEEQ